MQYDIYQSGVPYQKCRGTGKVSFPTKAEARWTMLHLRWSNAFKRDKVDGRRIKRRAGKSAHRRIYYCEVCSGYHLTRWTKRNYSSYKKAVDDDLL